MPFLCDVCAKEYKYKRNLTRHISEKHLNNEHWICTVDECRVKIIRRDYLSKHLIICHGYDSVTARESALNAVRGDHRAPAYYDTVSDDDSILDLLAESDGTMANQAFNEAMIHFNLGQFSPQSRSKDVNCNISDDVSVVSSVIESVKDSDSASINAAGVSNNQSDLCSDIHDGLSGNSDDNMAQGHYNDNSDDNMAQGHYNDYSDDISEPGEDIIIISSDEDDEPSTAIELSNVKIKTETFIFTVTRRIKLLNGHNVGEAVHVQRDYFEQFE